MNVKVYPEMGRGLEASENYRAGQIVMHCELLVLSEADTVKVNETDLRFYTFAYNKKQDCLVLGLGEIFNHSDSPNVTYNILEVEGRMMMEFRAAENIWPGQQMFIDYASDVKVDATKYRTNLAG